MTKTPETILADLADACELIDGYVDVKDGPYGTQVPNDAMQARTLLEEVMRDLPMLLRKQCS